MKRLILLLALGLLIASAGNLYSQTDRELIKIQKAMNKGKKWTFHTPEDEMLRFYHQFYAGFWTSFGGICLATGGVLLTYFDEPKPAYAAMYYIGGVGYVIGNVFMIKSFTHFGNAGRLMKKERYDKGLGLGISGNGLALVYKL